jgi:cob(I)alamin adenosyltransferase
MSDLGPGYIHVYTGDGKGKTTASFGLALRAVGNGLKVLVIQFMKGPEMTGERRMTGNRWDMLILDEINNACALGLIPVEGVLQLMDSKPDGLELVLTGRGAAQEVVEKADLVTEMKEVKHYYAKGVKARQGIEK